ncbi:MAG: hypothetical protein WBB22_14695 [Anaerolineae bacterium]
MTPGKSAKIVVLAILLIAAGFLFGRACEQVSRQYQLVLMLDRGFLYVLLWLVAAMATVAVTGGLVAALVRPLWVCVAAFAVSALAVFIAWEVSLASGVVTLIYLAVSLLYSRGVAEALDNRVKFSVEPISGSQSTLLAGLAIAASASLYFGYAAEIQEQGFAFPSVARETLSEMSMAPIRAQIEARTDLTSEQKDTLLAQASEGFEEQWITPVEETIRSYQEFVPWVIAFILFQLLAVLNSLFSWIPIIILAIIFPILAGLGVTGKVLETRDVERLVIVE